MLTDILVMTYFRKHDSFSSVITSKQSQPISLTPFTEDHHTLLIKLKKKKKENNAAQEKEPTLAQRGKSQIP